MNCILLSFALSLSLASATLQRWVDSEYIVVTDGPVATTYETSKTWNNIPNFNAFMSRFTPEQYSEVVKDPNVKYIEVNQPVYAYGNCPDIQTGDQSWGQSRTTSLNGTGDYKHNKNWGEGVDLYIIDTGVNCAHEEFSDSECTCGPTFAGGEDGCTDGNSHGTFCASIAAGKVYGVSKGANLIGVKVLSDSGMGSTAGVISGMNYVAGMEGNRVASMSLGGPFSQASNDAANALVKSGVALAVAAGNENSDTCGKSPASSGLALTVGSTTIDDKRSFFSNYGPCLDIYAPGSDITGASNKPGTYVTASGTSMATPHVAAVMAKIRGEDPSLSPANVKQQVLSTGLVNFVEDAKEGSPNTLLHVECGCAC